MIELSQIRNFAIIAHIDHGKSTLADRLIEYCGTIAQRDIKAQMLDSMDLERERGITIKAQAVRLPYIALNGQEYWLNLIDTPGHVDFTYEVSRSLAACEGSLLVVDASQGVEAQTLANVYLAIGCDHEIVPILNKIDLPAAEPDRIKRQIEDVIGIDTEHAVEASAKSGLGIREVLEAIVHHLPPPTVNLSDDKTGRSSKLRAMIIDSWYDTYLGVVSLIRVKEGVLSRGDRIRLLSTGAIHNADQLAVQTPKIEYVKSLGPGEVGVIIAGVKSVSDCKVGDTLTHERSEVEALPGFAPSIPVVFCGLFPVDASDFDDFKDALGKLGLNDSSFFWEAESSAALGFGFRCGFLGLLHLEIIRERLEREFDLDLIATAPSVVYRLTLSDGSQIELHNPNDMPDIMKIKAIAEPWIKATILVPDEYLGPVLSLCTDRRGIQQELTYVGNRAMVIYSLPLNEVVFDFYDRLKSISRGYASFDYEVNEYKESDLVKVNILINSDPVDALALVVHRSQAEARGRAICGRLKDLIPRQLFKVALQAAIGGKIIARESIAAMRKDVTAKCYGGDVSRKRKLLDKQKKGKKKMRQFGKIEVPQSAFLEALKMGE